jgi:hypothetical protein
VRCPLELARHQPQPGAELAAVGKLPRITDRRDHSRRHQRTDAFDFNQPLAAIVTNGQVCLRLLPLETPRPDETRVRVELIVVDARYAGGVAAPAPPGLRMRFAAGPGRTRIIAIMPPSSCARMWQW